MRISMAQRRGSRKLARDEKEKLKPSPPLTKSELKKEKGGVSGKWYCLLAGVLALSLVCYLNSLTNQFVFDDITILRKNPTIRGIENIPSLLGLGTYGVSYRPLRMVSYALDYTLNETLWRNVGGYSGKERGLNPFGYHLSNCVYHLVTSFLVFLVIYRLVASSRVAFLAASLFALHPVHTDSVTYISGRRDILFTLFYLLGFYFFLCYRVSKKLKLIIAFFLAYCLSLGSKEMGVTLPAIFLCYELVDNYSGKGNTINLNYFKELFLTFKRVIVQSKYLYSLVFLGTLAYSYYKVFIYSPSYRKSYYGESMLTTFLTVGKIVVHYVKLLLYPITLNADYYYNAFPLSPSLFDPATLFSFLLLGAMGYGVLRALVTHKMLAFGGMWFSITLLPVCHIFPHHELLAEHYLYLPSVGFCLIAALLMNSLLESKRYKNATYTSCVVLVLLFSLRIVDRNKDWKDGGTLWEKTVKTVPQCARAHSNLGLVYFEKGRVDEAIAEYTRAVAIKPDFPQAYDNLGIAYAKKGMFDEAIVEYKKAITLKAFYPEAYTNLGNAYGRKGRIDEAIAMYKIALVMKPSYALAHSNLGIAYAKKGMLDESIAEHRKALAIEPTLIEARTNLAVVYHQKGDLDQAIVTYTQALALDPRLAWVHSNLAAAYLKKEQYKLAITHCDRAIELGYKVTPTLLRDLQPYR